MTLIITTICADGVVLMTDGRMSKPLQNNEVITNDICKIEKIRPGFYVATAGVELASALSLIYFGDHVNRTNLQDANNVAQLLRESAKSGWETFEKQLPPTVDKSHVAMKNTLIVAGFLHEKPLVVGALYGSNVDSSVNSQNLYGCIVLGGEVCDAKAFFENLCAIKMKTSGTLKVSDVIAMGVETIRMAEKKDVTIGGKIRYVIIESGTNSTIQEYKT